MRQAGKLHIPHSNQQCKLLYRLRTWTVPIPASLDREEEGSKNATLRNASSDGSFLGKKAVNSHVESPVVKKASDEMNVAIHYNCHKSEMG